MSTPPTGRARRALLEIDWQGWIVELGHDPGAAQVARRERARARVRGDLVLCTRYLSRDPDDPVRSDPAGEGARFIAALGPEPGDVLLSKHGRDVFDNPDVADTLRLNGIREVTMTGVATDHGVLLAARSALGLGFDVRVVAGACAGTSEAAHRDALAAMRHLGVTCVGADSSA